jgi:hypothetical protein
MNNIDLDIWGIYENYLSDINGTYKKTIRKDVVKDYLYNEIRDVVRRHFRKSFRIEQVKRGVYYIVANKTYDMDLANMVFNCIK